MRGEAAHLILYLSALFYQRREGSILQVLGKSNERVLKVKNDVNEDITLIP